MKRRYSASVQKPITRSTPARLYQDRSNSTISPAVGRCATYRWKYHWCFSRSVGMSSATTCANRGFRCSMKRLIVLPLPAASRPSKTTTNRPPDLKTALEVVVLLAAEALGVGVLFAPGVNQRPVGVPEQRIVLVRVVDPYPRRHDAAAVAAIRAEGGPGMLVTGHIDPRPPVYSR